MQFTFVDFLIGFLLMNAMPHTLFGILKIRFLTVFGFSAAANLAYACLSVLVALFLFHYRYGLTSLPNHGAMIGGLAMLAIYAVSAKYFVNLFRKRDVEQQS